MDHIVAVELLHELLVGFFAVVQKYVRVSLHKDLAELGVIFAWNFWDLIRTLFHFGAPGRHMVLER